MKIFKNPFLLFSPFLIIYTIYVLNFQDSLILGGDRYLDLANNLLNGFYSPPAPNIDLWWGPGYPIILIPFVALNLPLVLISLTNAIFQYLAIIFLFKTLARFVSFQLAVGISLFWGFCFSVLGEIPVIHTEPLATFLISLLIFFVTHYFNSSKSKYLFSAGVTLGYLALTKVIFGYVIIALLLSSLFLLVVNRANENLKKSTYIFLIALTTTLPYLTYTYMLTNRILYWGTSGGMSFYWMSNPNEYEYGDWNFETLVPITSIDDTPIRMAFMQKTHQHDMNEVLQYTGVERDDAYKRLAIRNIKSHPIKFFKNIMSNASRLLFEFPFTYSYQRPQLKVFYFAIVFTLCLFSALVTLLNWSKIEFSIRLLICIGVVYLGGSLFLSMYNRMLLIIMPLLLLWIAYTLNKSLILKLKF